MEIKGDIRIRRTVIADRRVDQGLTVKTIVDTETLGRHSAAWQSLSAAAPQDVILPDATTLPVGWTVAVEAAGASVLTIKDNFAGATIDEVGINRAKRVYLKDNSTVDGVWFVEELSNPVIVPANRYTLTHDETASWGDASDGYYTISTTGATHGRGTRPTVQFYETIGDDEVEVIPDESKFVTATGNHSFRVCDDPDLRYVGKVIFV